MPAQSWNHTTGRNSKGQTKLDKRVSAKFCGFVSLFAKICGLLLFSAKFCTSQMKWFLQAHRQEPKGDGGQGTATTIYGMLWCLPTFLWWSFTKPLCRCACPSFACFLVTQGNLQKNKEFSVPIELPRTLGKEGKNAQNPMKTLQGKKTRKSEEPWVWGARLIPALG